MPGFNELSIMALAVVMATVFAAVGASVAKRKGRNAWAWFFICLFGSVLGVVAVMSLTTLRAECPKCGAAFRPGEPVCSGCGASLPDRYAAERLAASGVRHELQCPACEMPYRLEDYRKDAAEIRCCRCNAALPREAPPAPEAEPEASADT